MQIGRYSSRLHHDDRDTMVGTVITFHTNDRYPAKDPEAEYEIRGKDSVKTGDLQHPQLCSFQPANNQRRKEEQRGPPSLSLSQTKSSIARVSRKPSLPIKNVSLLDEEEEDDDENDIDDISIGDYVEITAGMDKGRRGKVLMVTSYLLEVEFGGKERERKYFSPHCVRHRHVNHVPPPVPPPKVDPRRLPFHQALYERPNLTGIIIEVPTQVSEQTCGTKGVSSLGVPSSLREVNKSKIMRREPIDCDGISLSSAQKNQQAQRVKVILDELHDISEALSKEMSIPPPRVPKKDPVQHFKHILSGEGTATTCSLTDRSEKQQQPRDAPVTTTSVQKFTVGGVVDIIDGMHKDKSARVTKVTQEAIQVKVTGSSQVSLLSPRWLKARPDCGPVVSSLYSSSEPLKDNNKPDPPTTKTDNGQVSRAYFLSSTRAHQLPRPNFHDFLGG